MNSTLENVLIFLPVLLLSMSLHEMMHAYTADWLGDSTSRLMGRVTINPLKHIDPMLTIAVPLLLLLSGAPPFGAAKPVQVDFRRLRYDEFGGALVGMAGPLTNLVLALVFAGIFQLGLPYGGVTFQIVGMAILINVSFFLFNIIPWPPLDGSRLLYAFAPELLQDFMRTIESSGLMSLVIFVFIFYYLLSAPFGNLIGDIMNHLAPGYLQSAGL